MGDHHDHSCGCGCGGGSCGPSSRDWRRAPAETMVCPCAGVDKAGILAAIERGAYTVPMLKLMTGAGRGDKCKDLHPRGGCLGDLDSLVKIYGRPPDGAGGGGCGC